MVNGIAGHFEERRQDVLAWPWKLFCLQWCEWLAWNVREQKRRWRQQQKQKRQEVEQETREAHQRALGGGGW